MRTRVFAVIAAGAATAILSACPGPQATSAVNTLSGPEAFRVAQSRALFPEDSGVPDLLVYMGDQAFTLPCDAGRGLILPTVTEETQMVIVIYVDLDGGFGVGDYFGDLGLDAPGAVAVRATIEPDGGSNLSSEYVSGTFDVSLLTSTTIVGSFDLGGVNLEDGGYFPLKGEFTAVNSCP